MALRLVVKTTSRPTRTCANLTGRPIGWRHETALGEYPAAEVGREAHVRGVGNLSESSVWSLSIEEAGPTSESAACAC